MTSANQHPGGALVPAGSPVGGGSAPAAPGLHNAPSQAGVGNEGSLHPTNAERPRRPVPEGSPHTIACEARSPESSNAPPTPGSPAQRFTGDVAVPDLGRKPMRRSTNIHNYGRPFRGTVDPAAWDRLMRLSDSELSALQSEAVRELRR